MEIDTRNLELQEEINKIAREYRLAFDCPHCHKEINETHFGEKEKAFQLIKEKVRKVAEEEFNSRKGLYNQQLLKKIEESKFYENFQEVIKKTTTIEELKKTIESLNGDISKLKSSDEVEKLERVKELKEKVDRYQKENEELKERNQPEIQTLRKTIEKLKAELSSAYSSDKVESLTRFKELKKIIEDKSKSIEDFKENIAKLQSSDEVEKLERVKELKEKVDRYQKENEELKERNRDLIISKNKDSQRKGEEFEQWFLEELIKVFDGWDNIKDVSKGQTGLGKRADFLQEVLTETEPKKVVGKIVYETKNTEKWDNNWVTKLEKDMQTHGAEFGFIVATCANDKIIRLAESVDPRKKIYVSDGNSNLFLVVKIVRELLINRYNFMKMSNSTEKEKKLIKIEDWVNSKLPGYIMNLAKQLDYQEDAVKTIINKAEKIKKFKDEIYRLTMNNIISELKGCLEY